MFYLRLFGSPTLSQGGIALQGRAAQRHRIALLALLATAGGRGVGRERLMAMLWPETGPDRARNLLKASVYELRRALGADALLSIGDELRLNPAAVASDIDAFETALASQDYDRAVTLHEAPFMDGFFLKRAPTFERWVDHERERLGRACLGAIEAQAEAAEAAGDLQSASEHWDAASARSPYDSRLALRLLRVLETMGNLGGALQRADAHERTLRNDLGISPPDDVTSFAERLRRHALAARASPGPSSAARGPGHAADPPFRLKTLGRLALQGPGGIVAANSAENELGLTLLAVLAGAGATGVARETLLLYFWPDRPWREAAAALDGLLHRIQGWTGESALVTGDLFALDRAVIASDLADLERAASGGSPEQVLALTRDTFLGSGEQEWSPELGAWVRGQRRRLDAMREDAERTWHVSAPPPARAPVRRPGWRLARPEVLGFGVAALSLVALVAYAIVAASPPPKPLLPRETTTSSLARDLFDQANVPLRYRDDDVARVSLDLFRRAVEADPGFAGAHAELAVMYLRIAPAENPAMTVGERIPTAVWHARRAVELADSLGRAHAALGAALLRDYDFKGARTALTRALELDPSDGYTHQFMVHLLIFQGRFDAALEQALLGQELAPASSDAIAELARAYRVNGRCDDSYVWLDRLDSVDPPLLVAPVLRAQCLAQDGRWDEAIDVLRGARVAGPLVRGMLGFTLARAARAGAAAGRNPSELALWETETRAILDTLRAWVPRGRGTSGDVANVYIGLGELDLAFDWLERALDDRSLRFGIMEPQYEELQRNPRFETLLDRLGLGLPGG
jgi:DNA-binding SARP family transcriptional activator